MSNSKKTNDYSMNLNIKNLEQNLQIELIKIVTNFEKISLFLEKDLFNKLEK